MRVDVGVRRAHRAPVTPQLSCLHERVVALRAAPSLVELRGLMVRDRDLLRSLGPFTVAGLLVAEDAEVQLVLVGVRWQRPLVTGAHRVLRVRHVAGVVRLMAQSSSHTVVILRHCVVSIAVLLMVLPLLDGTRHA